MYSGVHRPLNFHIPHKCTSEWIPWSWCVDCLDFCSVPFRRFVQLPCCQEDWVPVETPLHLPGTLQVDRTDILFSHWQIKADRESGHVLPYHIVELFYITVTLFELYVTFFPYISTMPYWRFYSSWGLRYWHFCIIVFHHLYMKAYLPLCTLLN